MADPEEAMNNDDTVRAMVRNESKVDALADRVRELKTSFEEFIDRFEADFDVFRDKIANFAVVGSAVEDHKRMIPSLAARLEERTAALDSKVEERSSARRDEIAKMETKIATLELNLSNTREEKAKLETKVEAVSARVYYISGAAAVLSWIASQVVQVLHK